MYILGNIWRAKYTKYVKYMLAKYGPKYTILPKVLAPLLMKGLTTLVISMSMNLNVEAYNDILGNLIV